jgi:hypothetical protein
MISSANAMCVRKHGLQTIAFYERWVCFPAIYVSYFLKPYKINVMKYGE